MKKLLFAVIFTILAAELPALQPGDMALDLNRVDFVRGGGIVAGGKLPPKADGTRELRLVVFLYCRSHDSLETVRRLDALRAEYSGKIRIAVITPDHVSEAEEFVKALPSNGVSFGCDLDRRITPQYMAGSLLYPMAFAIDSDGRIIWRGEAVDCHEMVEQYFNGRFNAGVQREISVAMDEMQNYIRGGDERRMKKCVRKILDLEPGHPGALRIRCFVLENSSRVDDAWELLESEIDRSPTLARLYISAFDLICRNRSLSDKLAGLLEKFETNISNPRDCNAMAWGLLNMFDCNFTALSYAGRFYNKASNAGNNGNVQVTGALLAYRMGDLDTAIARQQQAVEFFEKSGMRSLADSNREKLEFFNQVKAMRK